MTRAWVVLLLGACAVSHGRNQDAGVGATDTTADVRLSTDVPVADTPSIDAPVVACGPNVCRPFEICCNPTCGVCAFPDECTDFGCAGDRDH